MHDQIQVILWTQLLDVVELRGGDRYKGTLQDQSYSLQTPYGLVQLPAERVVAMLTVGDFRPTQLLVTTDGEAFGGQIVHAPRQMHGKTSEITHDGRGVFAGLPSPFVATRYHSLVLDHAGFPAELHANAASDDGVIQGIAHRELPLAGVQFHPESVLTLVGPTIAQNVVRGLR